MISDEYLAGFFDGEGYVGVAAWKNGASYVLRCTIANMDLNVLEKIQELRNKNMFTKSLR